MPFLDSVKIDPFIDSLNVQIPSKEKFCNENGIRLLKIAMPWPLEENIVEEFSKGLYTIIVIEEKRSLIEYQLKNILFNKNSSVNILGKKDLNDNILFPSSGSLNPCLIATKLGEIIYNKYMSWLTHNLFL